MAGKDIIMLSQDEVKKLHVIKKVLDGGLRQYEAADVLSLSVRQVRRLVLRVRAEGNVGIVHRSRGKRSGRGISGKVRDKVLSFYRENLFGFGPTLAAEKISELLRINLSDETLRKWLMESGDWKRTRKCKVHRSWRERKGHFGEMVQFDGSHHDWFEGRGEKAVLMGYIDDATGNVFARFYEYEGTIPAMDSFGRYVKKYGVPISVYNDKHSTYKSMGKPTIEDELNGTMPMSEFERAMKELSVNVIHANSPQAKGRVERLFKTFQDRVVKEMRLRGIQTIESANKFLQWYLPIYNRRFAVKAKKEGDLHRKITKEINLSRILCIKTKRVLRNDFTISYENRFYQILERTQARTVQVEEDLKGGMSITYKGKCLKYKGLPERPKKENPTTTVPIFKTKKKWTPPADHPWRKRMID